MAFIRLLTNKELIIIAVLVGKFRNYLLLMKEVPTIYTICIDDKLLYKRIVKM